MSLVKVPDQLGHLLQQNEQLSWVVGLKQRLLWEIVQVPIKLRDWLQKVDPSGVFIWAFFIFEWTHLSDRMRFFTNTPRAWGFPHRRIPQKLYFSLRREVPFSTSIGKPSSVLEHFCDFQLCDLHNFFKQLLITFLNNYYKFCWIIKQH